MEINAFNPNAANYGQPTRARQLDLSLTDSEYDEIKAAAMKSGTSIRDFARLKLLEVLRKPKG